MSHLIAQIEAIPPTAQIYIAMAQGGLIVYLLSFLYAYGWRYEHPMPWIKGIAMSGFAVFLFCSLGSFFNS